MPWPYHTSLPYITIDVCLVLHSQWDEGDAVRVLTRYRQFVAL